MSRAHWGLLPAVAVLLGVAASNGDTSPGSSNTASPFTFVVVGRVLGPSDVGVSPGETTGTADVSAIALPDGRIRVYFGRFGTAPLSQIASAITSDGVHLTIEPGTRLDGASPFVFKLPDGRYHLFDPGCQPSSTGPPNCGVESAISSDGLTFVEEPGIRLPRFSPYIQGHDPVCSTIVKLADGRYRMYCSQAVRPDNPPTASGSGLRAIFSAVSSDLYTWTPEAGIRIGPGAPSVTGDADHPTAVANADGSISLIYDGFFNGTAETHEMIATSKDGLSFDAATDTGIVGTEPSLASLGNGSLLLYYGEHTSTDGSTINVARVFLNRRLTVTVHGHGSVTSTPAGISCPKSCAAPFDDGKIVTLQARPRRGYVFAGWSGACAGHGKCSLRIHGNKSVGARFVRARRT